MKEEELSSPQSNSRWSIGELAEEFGVTPRTLRFYETEGLLAPTRRGKNRVYRRRDRARLILILRGRRLGFSLAEIKEMLDLYDVDPQHVRQLEHAIKKGQEQIKALEQQLEDISSALAELKELERKARRQLQERKNELMKEE